MFTCPHRLTPHEICDSYGDFVVHEVDESGSVVYLNDIDTVPSADTDPTEQSAEALQEARLKAVAELRQMLGDEQVCGAGCFIAVN